MNVLIVVLAVFGAWCAVSLTVTGIVCVAVTRIRRHKTPAPGEGSPRPAAATIPRGPQVPGSPWPPQHDCGAVIEHTETETRECGCHIKLDHRLRKRKVHHCGRLDFDVNEWERRLTL